MALKALEVARVFVPSLEEEAERSEVERAMQGLWVLARISHTSRLAVVGGWPDKPLRVAGPL